MTGTALGADEVQAPAITIHSGRCAICLLPCPLDDAGDVVPHQDQVLAQYLCEGRGRPPLGAELVPLRSDVRRWRKKPVEVEAVPVRDAIAYAAHDWDRLPSWVAAASEAGTVLFLREPDRVSIRTLEGTMVAHVGDWIVRGVAGEMYPVRGDIFRATYEPVEATP